MKYVKTNIKNNYNTSSIGSIGTETANVTDSSPTLYTLLQKGGFLFGGSDLENLAFKYINDGNLSELNSFLIRENMINFTVKDDFGNTILHNLISKHSDNSFSIIKNILSNQKVSDFINIQNNDGDTPLHIAVKQHNHKIADLLVSSGADINIINNDGFKVESDNELSERINMESDNDILKKVFETELSDDDVANSDSSLFNTDVFIKSLKQPDNVNVKTIFVNDTTQKGGVISGRRTMKTYSDMSYSELSNFSSIKTSTSLYGGSDKTNLESIKTNDIYDNISEENNESDEDMRELSRLIKNQTDEIHERVVLKIMEIMNVPRDMAENYKSAIYRRVKTEKPELNGFDRAVEMEKLATRENLELVNIQAYSEEREKYLKEYREKKQLDKPKNKKPADTPTDSSSDTTEEKPKKKTTKKETKKTTKKSKK